MFSTHTTYLQDIAWCPRGTEIAFFLYENLIFCAAFVTFGGPAIIPDTDNVKMLSFWFIFLPLG